MSTTRLVAKMALGDSPQSMAAMSCCPGGAVTVLGVALGHLVSSAWNRRSLKRARRRELEMLTAMWETEFVGPTGVSDDTTGRSQLDR